VSLNQTGHAVKICSGTAITSVAHIKILKKNRQNPVRKKQSMSQVYFSPQFDPVMTAPVESVEFRRREPEKKEHSGSARLILRCG
jgi:hypothetical protein